MTPPTIVLVHGAGGSEPIEKWLTSINAAMLQMGYPQVDSRTDRLVACDYEAILRSPMPSTMPTLARRHNASKSTTELARVRFAVHQAALSRVVAGLADEAAFAPSDLAQQSWAKRVGFVGAQKLLELLRIYHSDEKRRLASQAHVLSAIPAKNPSIIVSHSLGTVVVADVLRRLPASAQVELLVTLGSPLAASAIGDDDHGLADDFPVDRVFRWLNVYNTQDVVTGFGGLSARYRHAVDVQVALGPLVHRGSHDLTGYLRTRPVAAALREVMFDTKGPTDPEPDDRLLARNLHPWWRASLMQAAYARLVAEALPSKEGRLKLRIDGALETCANDVVALIKHAQTTSPQSNVDNPTASGRAPTRRDLMGGGWRSISHDLTDRQLLPHVVTLMVQPIVPAFDMQVGDEDIRDKAMERLLNRLRKPGSDLADGDYVEKVRRSLEWARKEIAPTFPFGAVLVGAGLVVLAATGVGLAVAAPAGFAGAAAIASTLAAFGPGGMAGGIATLAALTGTGAGAGGFGVGILSDKEEEARAVPVAELGRSMETLSLTALKAALITLLATVKAAFAIDRSVDLTLYSALVTVRDSLRVQFDLLTEFSHGSPMFDECEKKLNLVERAIASLGKLVDESTAKSNPAVLAIENGV